MKLSKGEASQGDVYSSTTSKRVRKSKRKMAEEVALNSVDISGLQPMLAGSPEEIAALLKEAYDNIPERTGRRGKRRARRMRRKAFLVQKSHRHKKLWRIGAHEKRMEKRARIARECREVSRWGCWMVHQPQTIINISCTHLSTPPHSTPFRPTQMRALSHELYPEHNKGKVRIGLLTR